MLYFRLELFPSSAPRGCCPRETGEAGMESKPRRRGFILLEVYGKAGPQGQLHAGWCLPDLELWRLQHGGGRRRNSLFQQGATRPALAGDGRAQHRVADKALEMTRSHEAICHHLPSLPPPGALQINLQRMGCRWRAGGPSSSCWCVTVRQCQATLTGGISCLGCWRSPAAAGTA